MRRIAGNAPDAAAVVYYIDDRGLDGQLAGRDQREHAVAVRAQPKEVVPLFGRDQRQGRVLDAVAVHDLRALLELLAPGAVQTFVVGHEEVVGAALLDALEQRDHALHVPRFRRPDPVVVAAPEVGPILGEQPGHPVHPGARRHPRPLGGLDHRLAVLVHAHQKMDLVAAQPAVPRDAVRPDLLEGVPQMGVAVRVVDGGCQIELRH